MKKKTLLSSVILGFYGFNGSASAANLNHNGFGQALIYPYYTVNNDLNTLLSVVNTTIDVKAVKIRFMEGDNGQEVLDFNLYLGPFDVWTAALSATETGAQISSADDSCTPFLSNPQPFLDFVFVQDPGSDEEEREREGHFEIIEMGVVTDPILAASATLFDGSPTDCQALENAWAPLVGQWTLDPSDGIEAATGGLFGNGLIVDVTEGTAISYGPETIDDFYDTGGFLHTEPGSLEPSLASAHPKSVLIDSGNLIESEWPNGIDAISALFMYGAVYNEYTLASGIDAKTEWILTYPTKPFYVNDSEPRAPFNSVFSGPEGACEDYLPNLYDRESQTIEATGQVCTPPPRILPHMCWNTNVIHFYDCDSGGSDTDVSLIFGSTNVYGLKTSPFTAGWIDLFLPNSAPFTDSSDRYTYYGYPITGFAVQTYTNANAQPGLLAQYAAMFSHTYIRSITSASQ